MKTSLSAEEKIKKAQEKIKEVKERNTAFWVVNNMPEDLVEDRTEFNEMKGWLFGLVGVIESLEKIIAPEDKDKIHEVYDKEELPTMDHVRDEIIMDNYEIGDELNFMYDGKKYHAKVKGTGRFVEYGIEESEITITEGE